MLYLPKFLQLSFPEKFSFEKEFLEKQTNNQELFGFVQDAYFIDIGIPEDYAKAQIDLK
jgi:D-glycero-alpha-D-manno-heptose 1-phosphate guanylyltransferase